MSSVDKRIVEMQFNNERFERNAKQSMSTLDKLKEKLSFKGQTKELQDFQSTADSFNLSRIATALDAIGEKFTMMGNLGQQAMQRIANSAIDMGVNLVKSISVDQISEGFSKYEQETNTVQTLLASLKPKGKTKEDIYAGLDELAKYSDETSYSYTQMASAVSNFVNAGQDFNDSIVAMQGIANVAAQAGVSIQDAQIAFRNFSDAMGKGAFRRDDWKSIQLIHMDAEWYKQSLLETAAELGKIEKEGDQFFYTHGTGKNKKREEVNATNFAEFLQYKIIDQEVLMKNSMKWAKDQEAFAAAQNAKTFTDVMDAVKDAVSTSWKQSFRIIFGDVEEAINLFTPMANKIIDFTSSIGEARNEMLSGWKELGGRDSMIGALNNIWDVVTTLKEAFDEALDDAFNFGRGIEPLSMNLYHITLAIQNATKKLVDWITDTENGGKRLEKIKSIFRGVFSVVNIARQILSGFWLLVKNVFKQLEPTFDAIIDLFSTIGADLFGLNDQMAHSSGIMDFFRKLSTIFEPITSRLPKVIGKIKELYERLKKFWNENSKIKTFRKRIRELVDGIVKFIPQAIESVIAFGKSFIEMVKNSDEWKWLVTNYNKYIKPVVDLIVDAANIFTKYLGEFFNVDTSDQNTLWDKLKKRFAVFDQLGPWFENKWSHLKETYPILQQVEDWWNTNSVVKHIKKWIAAIGEAIDKFMSTDTSDETSIAGKLKKRFDAMWASIEPIFTEYYTKLKEKFPVIQQIEDFFKQLFGGGGKETEEAAKDGEQTASEGEQTVGFFEQLWSKIEEFAGKIDVGKLGGLVAAIAALIWVYKKVKTLLGWASLGEKIGEAVESVTATINQVKKTLKNQNMESKVRSILGIAASIWLLGDTLVKVSKLDWAEIGRGLAGMAGLFVEEGAFMVVMGMLSKKGVFDGNGVKPMKLIGTAIAMWILGKALKDVSELQWDEIGRGLTAMAGLFVETGVFTILVNRFGKTGLFERKGTSATGLIGTAVAMWILGKALKDVSDLQWAEIGRGLTAMAGLFLETGAFTILVNRLGKTSIIEKKGANSSTLLSTAKMIKSLADTLKKLADMTWAEIGRGLSAMGGLFLETGAFMILVNRLGSPGNILQKSGTKGILSTAGSIYILAGKLKDLGTMTWAEIGRGLSAMAGLFVEEGAFMTIIGFLSKKNIINPGAVNATTGILAGGIGAMGNAMEKLGKLSIKEIIKGAIALGAIEVLLGLYVGLTSKLEKVKLKTGVSMIIMAGAIWIMAQAFVPLASVPKDQLLTGIEAMVSVVIALGLFTYAMSGVESNLKTTLGIIVSAIALAALMVAFAFALTLIKDVDPKLVVAFGAAMILVSGAMVGLSKALDVFKNMSVGAVLKGTLIMVIAAAGVAAAIALILAITSGAIDGFGQTIANVGSYLGLYSEMVEGINMDAVQASITMIKDLAACFVEVGLKDYGNLEVFRTNLTRMGASIRLFGLNTVDADIEKMKSISGALKQMATDLSGFPEVSDVGTSIGNIGGAIKLYSESLNGVNLDEAPDTSALQRVFETLRTAIPNDENLTEVAGFASEGKGNDMTNFAIGLTNIATAISSFSESAKDLDFTNIQKATDALTAISKLDTGTSTTSVTHIGPFAKEVSEQKPSLSTFSEDIVSLGTALKDFGDNISKVNTDKMKEGTGVLEQIANLNEKLPKEGGISQWLSGTVSLTKFAGQLKLLGQGAKDFNDSIMGGEHAFDAAKVKAAGEALAVIGDINGKLPQTGGISSWFTGNKDLGNFGRNLKDLGSGVAQFADSLEGKEIGKNVTDGINVINRLASIQIRLGSVETWYDLSTFGSYISSMATSAQSANNTLSGITWTDTTTFENFMNAMADIQVKLGGTEYKKNLRQLGEDLKGFYENVYSFNTSFMNGDNGKLNKVTESIQGIFGTLNEFITNTENNGEYTKAGESIVTSIADGISNDSSKTTANNKMTEVLKSISGTVSDYYQNFVNVATWIPAGLGEGIRKNKNAAINAIIDVMNNVIRVGKNMLMIKSPSKVFEEMGMYSDMGMANGIRNYIPVVSEAGKSMANDAVRSVLDGMRDIQNLPLEDMDITPTIRPVLDTSDLRGSAGIINGLLGDATRGIGFNTKAIETKAQILNENYTPDIAAIGAKVQEMNDKIGELSVAMGQMKIVLNNGALVGGLESEIDRSLGIRRRKAERGI